MKKRITITLPQWAVDKLEEMADSPFYQNRGWRFTKSDIIAEMIANYEDFLERAIRCGATYVDD